MARYLTSGVVVLADDHPNAQGTIDTARAYAGHRYAVGHDAGARFRGFDEVVDPGRHQPTVATAFKEAARRRIPWVAVRRDLAPPAELLAQMLEATARQTSKELPGFVVLLTAPETREVRRILAVVDRSDGQPSGLLVLAAVAAAEQTGAAVDVLVIGAPNDELSSSAIPDTILRVARDRDLYEQAKRRSASLGARGNWMFIDNVDSRVQLVSDVLAAHEYDLVVDDLGDINLGGRIGRAKRIGKALREDGPASITLAVIGQTDLPVLLVLDAVRLGLIPAKVKVGAGASILAMGVMVSAAPKAAAGPAEREQAQTTISQTVEDYDTALAAAANLATPAQVEEVHAQAQASGDEAEAVVTGVDSEATVTAEQSSDVSQQADDEQTAETPADEGAADEQAASEAQPDGQSGEDQAADEQAAEGQAADEQTADEADGGAAADVESQAADVSPAALAPEDVTPEKAPQADADDIEVPDDVSQDDVSDANKEADQSKAALDDAQDEFDQTQDAAVEAKAAAEDASAAAVQASSELDQANEAYQQATDQAGEVIADATGVSGALPGGASEEDLAAAEAQETAAFAELEEAGQQADAALLDYETAATEAVETSAELDAAAADVTDAQTEYNEDQATAEATEGAYHEKMADARVSPVAEGEYNESAHYGDSGSMWSTGHHTGEDYAAPIGTNVMAAASGTVVEAGSNGAYGNQVVIEHENGYYTTYSHLSEINVTVGQEVTAGDTIGAVGNTGNTSGPHLHFEVTQGGDGWSGGNFVDPHAWLEGEVG